MARRIDERALAHADAVACEIDAGYDAEALLGDLVPLLVALAEKHLGGEAVMAELLVMVEDMRDEP